jgi:hypothetical protein
MKRCLALLAGSMLFVLSCGGDSATTTVDAPRLLAGAVEATKQVTSFHFHLTHENGGTPMPLNLELQEAEGDVQVPDRLAAEVKAKAGPLSASVDVVGIGEQTWVTNPFTRRWQLLAGTTVQDIADPVALMTSVLGAIKDPEVKSETEVNDVKAFRLTGTLDAGSLKQALDFAQAGLSVSVELLIGVNDSLPRRARLSGRLSDSEASNIVRQIDLTRFNEKVDIRPPE